MCPPRPLYFPSLIDAAATEAVLPYLRKFFNATTNAIKIDARDANVSWTGPDQVVDGSCDHKVTAEHPKGTGTMLNTSYLQFGINKMNWTSIAVFADGEVDRLVTISLSHYLSHYLLYNSRILTVLFVKSRTVA